MLSERSLMFAFKDGGDVAADWFSLKLDLDGLIRGRGV